MRRTAKKAAKTKGRKNASVSEIARRLGCSYKSIVKVANAFYEGGDIACSKLRWGRGRPPANHGLTSQEMEHAISKETNTKLGLASIQTRALKISKDTGKKVTAT